MKSCSVETKLLIHTLLRHLKLRMMKRTTKLRKILSLRKVKHLEPNRNSNECTQLIPLEIPESFYSEILTGQIQNPSVEVPQQFSEVLSSEEVNNT